MYLTKLLQQKSVTSAVFLRSGCIIIVYSFVLVITVIGLGLLC
jgi:hypothetical protein